MDENLSHGSCECDFVGLLPFFEPVDIGLDYGIVGGCGLRGHVESSTHLGPTPFDSPAALLGS